jgi:hypothetical protein
MALTRILVVVSLLCTAACGHWRTPSSPTPADVAHVVAFVDALPPCSSEGGEVGLRDALAAPLPAANVRLRGWLHLGSGTCTLLYCELHGMVDDGDGAPAPYRVRKACCNGCGGFWTLSPDRSPAQTRDDVVLLDARDQPLTWEGMDCSLPAMYPRANVEVIATGVLRAKTQDWVGIKAGELAGARLCRVPART